MTQRCETVIAKGSDGRHRLPHLALLLWCAGIAAVCSALTGCATAGRQNSPPASDSLSLRQAYSAAIADAAIYRPDRALPLKAIPADADSVDVVTWTPYGTSYKTDSLVRLDWGRVWVTLEPEVRDSCQRVAKSALTLSLQQLLGLPPLQEMRTFVRMRVATVNIKRPCPDPATTTTRCGGEFPASADARHEAWLMKQMLSAYRQPDGVPFTRFGYTYNWRSVGSHYGASEYVIDSASTVHVLAVVGTADYCG
jgi:hypothetical protein